MAIEEADLIISSNKVILMTGVEQAQPLSIAIKNKKIAWIGSHQDAKNFQGEHINFGNQAVLPGFIDAHGHASYLAFATQVANIASPPVGKINNIQDLQTELKNFIQDSDLQPGEWVMGLGYDDSLLAEQRHPTKDDLDEVSTEHPIYLIHVSAHLGAANSLGLSLANINSKTEDPPGGKIRRYKNSLEPNGVFEETAAYPLQQLAMSGYKDPIGSVKSAMEIYAKNGITTAQDGASSKETIGLMQAANAQGKINLDIISYPIGQNGLLKDIDTLSFGSYTGRLKIGGIKLILDGSPQGKTAYLTEPYYKPPHSELDSYKGYPLMPQSEVSKWVKKYAELKIPIMAHANGDAAADMLIEAVEQANMNSDHRTIMIHAQTVREDQLDQMRELKIIPSYFSTHTFYWGDWHRDSVFGEERAMRISPTKSSLDRNMPFTVHNDAPVVPPDMIRLLWSTTNRKTRSGKVLGEEQKISTYAALEAMTINAAYQHFEDDIKGTIEVGKQADLVILSEDPLSIHPEKLLNVKVVATYSKGIEIFNAKK
ncbi:amidohydrolase [Gammaproteobacteria bacterium]|nr:amidohydrolase [Gammaproteobacteria bacterium]MDC1147281.1 amidohydrolase [Gammaproteobacteria bacterium]